MFLQLLQLCSLTIITTHGWFAICIWKSHKNLALLFLASVCGSTHLQAVQFKRVKFPVGCYSLTSWFLATRRIFPCQPLLQWYVPQNTLCRKTSVTSPISQCVHKYKSHEPAARIPFSCIVYAGKQKAWPYSYQPGLIWIQDEYHWTNTQWLHTSQDRSQELLLVAKNNLSSV